MIFPTLRNEETNTPVRSEIFLRVSLGKRQCLYLEQGLTLYTSRQLTPDKEVIIGNGQNNA